jgi:hypothetical protein
MNKQITPTHPINPQGPSHLSPEKLSIFFSPPESVTINPMDVVSVRVADLSTPGKASTIRSGVYPEYSEGPCSQPVLPFVPYRRTPTDTVLPPIGVPTSEGIAWTEPSLYQIPLHLHLRFFNKCPNSEACHTHTDSLQVTVHIAFDPSHPDVIHGIVCANNPLVYVDPSGHFLVELVVGMAISALIGAVAGATIAAINGSNIGLGALTGGISGSLVFLGGVPGGALAGVINAAITGNDIGQGALWGAVGSAAGMLTSYGIGRMGIENAYIRAGVSIAAGGLVGGGLSTLAGGDFVQGFTSGIAGATFVYFASTGMARILRQSPTNVLPKEIEGKTYEAMEVNNGGTVTESADLQRGDGVYQSPNEVNFTGQLVAKTNEPGNMTYIFQDPNQSLINRAIDCFINHPKQCIEWFWKNIESAPERKEPVIDGGGGRRG